MAATGIREQLHQEVDKLLDERFPDRAQRREEAARQAALRHQAEGVWQAEVEPRRALAARAIELDDAIEKTAAELQRLIRERDQVTHDDYERAATQRRAVDIGGLLVGAPVAIPASLPADLLAHLPLQLADTKHLMQRYGIAERAKSKR